MRLPWLALLTFLHSGLFALSSSKAAGVDWQKSLVGVPRTRSPTASPTFHRLPLRDGKALAFLLTATHNNVLAALDPVGGSIAWRHINQEDDPLLLFRPNQDGIVTVSGVGGAMVRLLEVRTGHIIWEVRLHQPQFAYAVEPRSLGVDMIFAADGSPDLFVLTNGHSVYRLNGLTGDVKWQRRLAEQGSSTLFSQLASTASTVYTVGVVEASGSYSLHAESLDSSSGSSITTFTIPSHVADTSKNVILLSSGSRAPPTLVWVEKDSLKAKLLHTDAAKGPVITLDGFVALVDVQLSTDGYLVALRANHTASIFKADGTSKGVRLLWEFSDSASAKSHSESTFGGGYDKDGKPYISRTYWSAFFKACSMELFAPHGAEGKGTISGHNFAFSTAKHGVILHVAVEVANPREMVFVSRFAVTTSSGTFQLWQQEKLLWSREESLANIQAAEYVDLPQYLKDDVTQPDRSNRILRHLKELQNLPSFTKRFATRFITGSDPARAIPEHSFTPWRDTFGFKKFVIVATAFGKIMALDSLTGDVKWSQLLSLSDASGLPADLKIRLLIRNGNQSQGRRPEIFVVASSIQGTTLVYHFDALTGTSIGLRRNQGFAAAQYEIDRPTLTTLAFEENIGAIAIVDSEFEVHVYPPSAARSAHVAHADSYVTLVAKDGAVERLSAYKILDREDNTQPRALQVVPVWGLELQDGEKVEAILRVQRHPIASFGKVLGNRTTLYKYLNPHLTAVIISSSGFSPTECKVALLDGVKGTIHYQSSFRSTSCVVKMALVENTFVFSYFEGGSDLDDKGHRIVSVELFEGMGADESTSSPHMSSFSPDGARVTTYQRSYISSHGILAITSTSTKFGITLHDFIVATDLAQIHAVSSRHIDPRRPSRGPIAENQVEGLIPFDPVLVDDAKRVLSHSQPVSRVKDIITSPTQLESTSIVFAYGLDLFMTRVAPSNTFDLLSEDFNRLQLLVTTAGLGLAILITRPLVKGRMLKAEWYF